MSSSAETYRSQAREIADLAERAEDPSVKAELMALAERFRRLADYVDGHSHGAASLPLGLRPYDQR
jgi:hypothetical protein